MWHAQLAPHMSQPQTNASILLSIQLAHVLTHPLLLSGMEASVYPATYHNIGIMILLNVSTVHRALTTMSVLKNVLNVVLALHSI